MGLWDKLGRASDHLRKLRLSLGPDSYFQYRRKRKQADDARGRADGRAERERVLAEGDVTREHEYEERYARERDSAAVQPEEADPDPDR